MSKIRSRNKSKSKIKIKSRMRRNSRSFSYSCSSSYSSSVTFSEKSLLLCSFLMGRRPSAGVCFSDGSGDARTAGGRSCWTTGQPPRKPERC